LLKDKPQYPASRILYWLNKIDVKLISDTPYTFTGKYGKEQESQSRKEMYYACKTKALFEKKLYSDCIICCDEAISQITLFHTTMILDKYTEKQNQLALMVIYKLL
jgi:hypothetical protein